MGVLGGGLSPSPTPEEKGGEVYSYQEESVWDFLGKLPSQGLKVNQ